MAHYRVVNYGEREIEWDGGEEELFDTWDDGECTCGHDIMEHDEPGIDDGGDFSGPWKCAVKGCKCKDYAATECPVAFKRMAENA